MENEVVVYKYMDYRKYLRDFYEYKKSNQPGYSFRVFANKAQLKSPNYLKLVIDGQRRITDRNIHHFLRGLNIKGSPANYFKHLVQFNESTDVNEKMNLLEKVLQMKGRGLSSSYELSGDRIEVLKHWYYWVIRELVLHIDFTKDPVWISKILKTRITPKQAQEALELLLRLELLREEGGKIVQSEPLVSTTDEVSSLLLREIHKQFMELGIKSLVFDDIAEREASGLTIGLRSDQVPFFKQKLKEFRRELNCTFTGQGSSDEIYHLEMVFYPLTKKEVEQ